MNILANSYLAMMFLWALVTWSTLLALWVGYLAQVGRGSITLHSGLVG